MQKSVGVRRCRLVPVLRAETSTVENVEICVCVGGKIRVCMCVSPRACFQGTGEKRGNPCVCVCVCVCVASCLFSGPRRKTRKSVCVCVAPCLFSGPGRKTGKSVCVCVCVASYLFSGPRRKTRKSVCVSPRACFQGRNEHGENLGKVCVCVCVCVCVVSCLF